MSITLKQRLERHFVACAGVAAVASVGVAPDAHASIVYSGLVNIVIPNDSGGVYLNIVTGLTGSTRGGTPGWDINPYFGGNLLFPQAPGYGTVDDGTGLNRVAVLPAGTIINGANANNNHSGDGSNFPDTAPGGLYGFRFEDSLPAVRFATAGPNSSAGATDATARSWLTPTTTPARASPPALSRPPAPSPW